MGVSHEIMKMMVYSLYIHKLQNMALNDSYFRKEVK